MRRMTKINFKLDFQKKLEKNKFIIKYFAKVKKLQFFGGLEEKNRYQIFKLKESLLDWGIQLILMANIAKMIFELFFFFFK